MMSSEIVNRPSEPPSPTLIEFTRPMEAAVFPAQSTAGASRWRVAWKTNEDPCSRTAAGLP